VTPGQASTHAIATADTVAPYRLAIVRSSSRSKRPRVRFGSWKYAALCRQSSGASDAIRALSKRSVRMPDCIGLYTMTPVSCSAHHEMTSAAASRRMTENGGWSESTWRIASQRSSSRMSKLETPAARTFPSSISRSIVAHESSIGTPVWSDRWN
jgi:hypothetical protein